MSLRIYPLIYGQLSFGLTSSLAALNSSFKWRDHLRLTAFHPLLVRSFGGLARGTFLFRAHQTALSSSGMRASADELSAWEALTVALVGCVRRLDR